MWRIGQGRKSGIGRPDNSRKASRKLVTGSIWKSAHEKKALDIGGPAKLGQKTKRNVDFGKPFKITSKTAKPTEKVDRPVVKDWRDLQITDRTGSVVVYLDVYG
jgi:hypothetical protein